jgi:aspartyl/glutamyl-tRNA(Asn/Gln) amidotransferase B subunit
MLDDLKIGVELHLKLKLTKKLFCNCVYDETALINTHSCEICEGQPGTYPLLNEEAVRLGILAATLTKSKIPKKIYFHRKHYNYPDLPKGYQITMYKRGFLGTEGVVPIFDKYSEESSVLLTHIILEEDPCSYLKGQLNYNRAGSALLEIVTEPVFKNGIMVIRFIKTIVNLFHVAGIVEKSNKKVFRADINISTTDTVRSELKNLGSLDEIERAIDAEYNRHKREKPSQQETRSYEFLTNSTHFMRKKESSREYAYLPEYNIKPVKVNIPSHAYNVYEAFNALKHKLTGKINLSDTRLWTFANYPQFTHFLLKENERISEICRLADLNLKYEKQINLDTITKYTPETYRKKFIKVEKQSLDTVFKELVAKFNEKELNSPKIYNYIFGNLLHKTGASYEQIKEYLLNNGL